MKSLRYSFKTILAYLLSISLVLSGFPLKAFADGERLFFNFSPSDAAILKNTPINSDMTISIDGIDYMGGYRGPDCSLPNCPIEFSPFVALGPTEFGSTKPGELKIRSVDHVPVDGPNSSGGYENPSIDATNPSTGSAEALPNDNKGSTNNQETGNTSTPTQGNRNSSGSPNYGESAKKGLQAGLVTGAITAFQDYVIFNQASLEELSKLQTQYQNAAKNADNAIQDFREQTADLNQTVFDNLKTVKANLQTFESSKVNFSEYLRQIDLNMQPSAQQLETAMNQVYAKSTTRQSYKTKTRALVTKLNNTPPTNSVVEKDFKKMAISAIEASAQSELLSDYEVSDINLEMAKMSLDVLYGLDPYTGLHRDLYELTTGKNLITGERLTDFERAISGVGLAGFFVSAGLSSSLSNGLKASFRFIRAGLKEGSMITRAISIIEKSKSIIKQLERLHAPIRSSLQDIAKFMKKEGRKLSPNILGDVEKSTEMLFKSGVENGRLRKLERLPKEILKNPSHPLSINRIREVALDGMKIGEKDILHGNNGKIAIIGRRMSRIMAYADNLKKEGFVVELFEHDWMIKNGMAPTLSAAARDEFMTAIAKGTIPYKDMKRMKIMQENYKWIKNAVDKGYTIINTGVPADMINSRSAMYDMELAVTKMMDNL